MEADPGERDALGDGRDRCRAEWAPGRAQGEHGDRASLVAAKADPQSNDLVRAVASDFETSEGRHAARERLQATLRGAKAADVEAKSIAALHDVAALIDQKAPGDAPGFKTWLHHIAEGAAEAANEGGFLGFGGVPVSDAEKATLGELSSALGLRA